MSHLRTHTLRSSVQTRLNRSRCRFGCGLAWAQSIMCYMGGPDPPWQRAFLVDRDAHCKVLTHCAVSCAKTAEPIHLPFRLWTSVGRRMHKFNRSRQVAPMCPHGRTRCWYLSNNIEHPSTAAMRLMANYFDHLLDTPTYTVAQAAKRFEPSTVLWTFHTIQPSSWKWLCLIGHNINK